MTTQQQRGPGATGVVMVDPEVLAAFHPGFGSPFIVSCLDRIAVGDWGYVNQAEAEQNRAALAGGGTIWAAFEVPAGLLVDASLDDPEILIVEVAEAGRCRAVTTIRFLPAADQPRASEGHVEGAGHGR